MSDDMNMPGHDETEVTAPVEEGADTEVKEDDTDAPVEGGHETPEADDATPAV